MNRALRWLVAAALLAAVGVGAFAARSVGWERVFVDARTVVFPMGDAWYHAHRAAYSLSHFPEVLWFDPCVNHPDGSVVVWAPAYDWIVAGTARLVGGSRAAFERVGAWSPVAFGTLTVLPIFALGLLLRGAAVGLGAAAAYAVLPVAAEYARVGNMDHHAAVAFTGAWLVLGYALALDPRVRGRSLAALAAALAATRALLLLLWGGSLLYLGLGEAALVLAGAATARPGDAGAGRRDLLAAQAASAAATALLVAPVVWLASSPNSGDWSTVELSRLHVLAFACVAAVSGALWAWRGRSPAGSAWGGLLRVAAVGLPLLALLAAVPEVRNGVARSLAFLSLDDGYNERVLENWPIFYDQGRMSVVGAERRLGGFLYLLPLVPLAFLLGGRGGGGAGRSRPPEPWARRLYLAAWSAVIGALAVTQLRYANDWAPIGCVGAALLLARGGDALGRIGAPRLLGAGGAFAVGLAAAALALPRYHLPLVRDTRRLVAEARSGGDPALRTVDGSQLRFLQHVGALTRDAGDCALAAGSARKGVLVHPSIAPALFYVAQRAAPAANFGGYTGAAHYADAMTFLHTHSPEEALAVTVRLRTPYVLTAEEGWDDPDRVVVRLHREDGSARDGEPHLGRYRLLSEGPRGGLPLALFFQRESGGVPYKLFEVVEGARLAVPAPPGAEVTAQVAVRTPADRRFVFRARAVADDDGVAELRVPYPTGDDRAGGGLVQGSLRRGGAETALATGPWTVRSPRGVWRVDVSESAVARGELIALDPAAAQPR